MALTFTFTPDKDVYNDEEVLMFNSKWLAAWNPIVFKIESDLFPVNTADGQDVYSSVDSDGGRARLLLYNITDASIYVRGAQITVTGTVYDGVYTVLKYDPIQGRVTIDATYTATDNGTAVRYYTNYVAKLLVSAGLPSGHLWEVLKPMVDIETLTQRPDDTNLAVFDVSRSVQTKISTVNDLALVSLPNDINLWTAFEVEAHQEYLWFAGTDLTVQETVSSTQTNGGYMELVIPTSNDFNVGDWVKLTSTTDSASDAVVRIISKNTTTGDITVDCDYDAYVDITIVTKYDVTRSVIDSGYNTDGNTYYAHNAKLQANEYGSNLAEYVNVIETGYEATNLTEFESMQLVPDKFFDYTAIISELMIADLAAEEVPALEIVQYDTNGDEISTSYFGQGNQDVGVYRFSFLEDVPFELGILTFLVGATGVISPAVTAGSGTTTYKKNGVAWTSGTSATLGDVITIYHTVPSAITQINLESCNISNVSSITATVVNQACTVKLAGNTSLNKYNVVQLVDAKVTTGGSTFEWLGYADGYDSTALARIATASALVTWKANNIFMTTTKNGTFSPTITSTGGHTTEWYFSDSTITSNTVISKAVTGTTRQVYAWAKNVTSFTMTGQNLTGSLNFKYISLSGSINFSNNTISTLTYPSINTGIITLFSVGSNNTFTSLDLSGWTRIGGVLSFNGLSSLTSLLLPISSEIITSFDVNTCSALTSLDMSGLTNLGGTFTANTMTLLTSATFPTTSRVFSSFLFSSSKVTTLNISGLSGLGGSITLSANTLMTKLDLPTSSQTITTFNLSSSTVLAGTTSNPTGGLNTSSLTGLAGSMNFSSSPALTSINMSGNTVLSGTITFASCTNLATLTLPASSGVFTSFICTGTKLTNLDLSPLTGLGGVLTLSSNTLLTNITFPTSFTNTAKFTSFSFSTCAVDTVTNLGSDTTNKKFDVNNCSVTFSNNGMTTAQVNQLLVDFDAITANTGTNKTMVGTGNAALSVGPPNGSAARTQMLTEGWTTITVS